jgi:hypothetical protein
MSRNTWIHCVWAAGGNLVDVIDMALAKRLSMHCYMSESCAGTHSSFRPPDNARL